MLVISFDILTWPAAFLSFKQPKTSKLPNEMCKMDLFLCFMHFHIVDIQVREVKVVLSTKSALVANFQTNLADVFSYIIYHAPMMSSSPGWCVRLMTQYLNMVPCHQSGESMQQQNESKTNGRNRSLCSCFGSTYKPALFEAAHLESVYLCSDGLSFPA